MAEAVITRAISEVRSGDERVGAHTGATASKLSGYRRAPGRGLFPPGLRYIGPHGDYWIMERPARMLAGEYWSVFSVPAPWVVFVVEQTMVKLFARPDTLSSLDDQLYHLPLPGIRADGTAPFRPNGRRADTILAKTLARFEYHTWSGDLVGAPDEWAGMSPDRMLLHWARLEHPEAACRFAWKPYGSLKAVTDRITWNDTGVIKTLEEAIINASS